MAKRRNTRWTPARCRLYYTLRLFSFALLPVMPLCALPELVLCLLSVVYHVTRLLRQLGVGTVQWVDDVIMVTLVACVLIDG